MIENTRRSTAVRFLLSRAAWRQRNMRKQKMGVGMGAALSIGRGTRVASKKSVLLCLSCSILWSCGPVDGDGQVGSTPDVAGTPERVDAVPGDIVTVGH